MLHGYFNYTSTIADGYWDRHAFLRKWWRIYRGDRRWAPPHFPTLHRSLVAAKGDFLARQRPQLIHLEALQDTRRPDKKGLPGSPGPMWEHTVAAAVLLHDPRRRDGTGYLALMRCLNNVEVLERFLGLAMEQAAYSGCRRLVGPTGLSPHLQSGVLQDNFHIMPPLHTPYNPPYVPEVMQSVLSPLRSARLYHVATNTAQPPPARSTPDGIRIAPIPKEQWPHTLIPIFTRSFDDAGEFPAPDEEEAAFLLDWISAWPVAAWTAVQDEEPVGFLILQPDLARPVARAQGGRNHLWRLWLSWRSRRPVKAGRLLFAGVLPEYRGRGIGSLLWQHALSEARSAGWRELTIGPLPLSHPALPFLEARGAQARQSYRLYATEI